jgi:hypothetical protein
VTVARARVEGIWRNDQGEIRLDEPATGLLHTRMIGHASPEMARFIVAGGERIMEGGGLMTAFHDWADATGYDTESRQLLTDWGVRRRAQIERVHLLVRSRFLQMGVAVASLVLRGMLVSHPDRDHFDSAMRDEIARRAG